MVRSYLRHEPTLAFSLVTSPSSTAHVHLDPRDGRTAIVPALEDVLVWDLQHGTQLSAWHEVGHRAQVTAIARSPAAARNADTFAVGYADGSIRLWSAADGAATLTFNGHKSAVTSLAFDPQGLLLASGSQDTDIIIWDIVAEAGLFRLRGHRDAVSQVQFVPNPLADNEGTQSGDEQMEVVAGPSTMKRTGLSSRYLLSVAKDGFLKLWDLTLQHCVETAIPGKGELWSLAAAAVLSMDPGPLLDLKDDADESRRSSASKPAVVVLTGGTEGQCHVYELDLATLRLGLDQVLTTSKHSSSPEQRYFIDRGSLDLAAKGRVNQIAFSPSSASIRRTAKEDSEPSGEDAEPDYLAVSSSDRSVQVFRIRTKAELRKKLARRKQRSKAKAKDRKQASDDRTDEEDRQEKDGPEEAEVAISWLDRLDSHAIVRPSAGGRLKSFSLALSANNTGGVTGRLQASKAALLVLLGLSNNALETWTVPSAALSKADREALALTSNGADKKSKAIEPSLTASLDLPGHRSDVRALALSPDDALLASADSSGVLKIWNARSGRCVRTFTGCGYALSIIWLPGSRHLVLGGKDGSIRTFDIPAALMVQHLPGASEALKSKETTSTASAHSALFSGGTAHEGAVWSLALHPNGLSCVSASADKTVKFWEFEMQALADLGQANGPQTTQQQLVLVHVRTLQMTDDILAAKFSPDGRLLALAMLDATVKVFFSDSLKFYLSLFGHKLPVLALDISADSKLAITVSADKNVKIWGLDFGDCHRSLFAHEDSIMACGFEQGQQGGGLLGGREGASHHFWTAGKDGMLKHWDGDRFELIQTLEGHHGEIWALTVDSKGTFCATAGADRSIRTWEKTDEPLFLEEERERHMEKMYEAAGIARAADEGKAIGSLAPGSEHAEGADEQALGPEAGAVQKSTTETLIAGERLMEALDIADEDRRNAQLAESGGFGLAGRPPRHPLLLAAFGLGVGGGNVQVGGILSGADAIGEPTAEGYVLKVVEKILPAQLEDALLVLPFDKVISLMQYLDIWAKKDWNISLTSRILFFLLRTHHAQIVSNKVMRTTLINVRLHLQRALGRQRDTIGYNLAALRHARTSWVAERTAEMYERGIGLDMDEEAVREKISSKQKRKRKVVV